VLPRHHPEAKPMRRLLPLLVLLCLAFAPAPLPKRDRQSKGMLALVGVWDNKGGDRIEFTPTHMKSIRYPRIQYHLRVDPTANPKTYDLIGVVGTGAEGMSWKGIYKVEGDTLTRHYRPANNGRPASFEDRTPNTIIAVHTRVR
jgi:uncharacterized protein (TIGR03067 family)